MTIYYPYTYILKHVPSGMLYYGVRWQNVRLKKTPEQDFWVHYFTSSSKIKKLLKLHGKDSFEFEIRRKFNSVHEAREWETKVLRRLKVLNIPNKWLNRSNNKAILNEIHPKGGTDKHHKFTEESRKKMSDSAKARGSNRTGKSHSEESKQKMRESKLGKKTEKDNHFYGKKHSEETKQKISNMNTGIRYKRETCRGKKITETSNTTTEFLPVDCRRQIITTL